jgi:hypothetical protein
LLVGNVYTLRNSDEKRLGNWGAWEETGMTLEVSGMTFEGIQSMKSSQGNGGGWENQGIATKVSFWGLGHLSITVQSETLESLFTVLGTCSSGIKSQ